MQTYQVKTFNLGTLEGFSQKQIDEHLKLYAGYVKNVNELKISDAPYRFGFEFNGMRLHEYYFSQFEKSDAVGSTVKDAVIAQWGSFDAWMTEFKTVGMTRGIGWALMVRDEVTGNLHNIWVRDHELGNLAGQKVLLAMDVWEHAYLLDYLPSQRKEYIEAFFKNLNWNVVETRA